jgi:hypothetical protein
MKSSYFFALLPSFEIFQKRAIVVIVNTSRTIPAADNKPSVSIIEGQTGYWRLKSWKSLALIQFKTLLLY